MTLSCIGVVPRPVPPVTYVIHEPLCGRYAEINPHLRTWWLTGSARHATQFTSREEAERAMAWVIGDVGDVYHLTAADLRILER